MREEAESAVAWVRFWFSDKCAFLYFFSLGIYNRYVSLRKSVIMDSPLGGNTF